MSEELKYKVGDELVLKVVVDSIDGTVTPYHLRTLDGRFVCRISKESLEKSLVNLPPKPKVPQAVMEYYKQNISADYDYDEWFERSVMPDEVASWLYYDDDDDIIIKRQHAIATLIVYGPEAVEVEKEKKYKVYLKHTNQELLYYEDTDDFYFDHINKENITKSFTKKELIDAGFGGVFDNEMFEVEEEY